MELNLDRCVYLINPRAIRYIKYNHKDSIIIVMNGSKDERDDINIRINVSDDNDGEIYKEIRNKLFRKFGLREEKTYENVIKLFEKGMKTKEIANILRIRMGTVIKIIGKYNKKNLEDDDIEEMGKTTSEQSIIGIWVDDRGGEWVFNNNGILRMCNTDHKFTVINNELVYIENYGTKDAKTFMHKILMSPDRKTLKLSSHSGSGDWLLTRQ
ncbi:MAG: hypothetical protein LBQ93_07255 [Treponema sp.]|nr:hypothetical protein [Treponema sp.]